MNDSDNTPIETVRENVSPPKQDLMSKLRDKSLPSLDTDTNKSISSHTSNGHQGSPLDVFNCKSWIQHAMLSYTESKEDIVKTTIAPSQQRRGKRKAKKSLPPQAKKQTSSTPLTADNFGSNSVFQDSMWRQWDTRPRMLDLSEMDRVRFSKLSKMEKIEAAQVYQLRAFALLKDAEHDVGTCDEKESKIMDDLKQELVIARKDKEKMAHLEEEVLNLEAKLGELTTQKIDIESSLLYQRKLLNSTKLEASKEKERLKQCLGNAKSLVAANYCAGFNCAKDQALLLCPAHESKLKTMKLWCTVKDGEIVEEEEEEEEGEGGVC